METYAQYWARMLGELKERQAEIAEYQRNVEAERCHLWLDAEIEAFEAVGSDHDIEMLRQFAEWVRCR